MHRVKQVERTLIERILNSLGKFLIQLAVTLTFLGIVPVIILIFATLIKGYYVNSLVLCGILLTLIKANKMIQG